MGKVCTGLFYEEEGENEEQCNKREQDKLRNLESFDRQPEVFLHSTITKVGGK